MTAPPEPSAAEVARKPKRPRQPGHHAYAILNPYGDFWTPLTFSSPERARDHLQEFARGCSFQTDRFTFPEVTVQLRLRPAAVRSREAGGGDA